MRLFTLIIVGKLHLFDSGRGGSAILSHISPFILGSHNKTQNNPLHTLLRESLGSMTSDICLIPHVNGTELDKTVAVLSAVARMHRARLQSKKRSHHVVTDCRSPVNPPTRGYHASSASEASHDTAIFTGGRPTHLSPKAAATRGYSSDMEYAVHITPINKLDSGSINLHGVSKSDSLMHLPLPSKKAQTKFNKTVLRLSQETRKSISIRSRTERYRFLSRRYCCQM